MRTGPAPCTGWIEPLGRRLCLHEWGDAGAPPLLMFHGVTETGRLHDALAARLAADYHVLCPDMIGRGLSEWSAEPARDYRLTVYAALAEALIETLPERPVRILGTSMGGHFAIMVAGGRLMDRVSHLVLNDLGPALPERLLPRMGAAFATLPVFADAAEAEAHVRRAYRAIGPADDAEWAGRTAALLRRRDDGRFTLHYDPAIARQFDSAAEENDQWAAYDRVRAKTLLLRGEASPVLPEDMAAAMLRRGPRPRLVRFPGCGHAPALNRPEDARLIAAFLAT